MLDNKSLWDRVLVDMELAVSKANFTTWFKDTWVEKQEDGTVFLSVPNAFVKDWLSKKYHQILLKSLREVGEDIRALDYGVSKDSAADLKHRSPKLRAVTLASIQQGG